MASPMKETMMSTEPEADPDVQPQPNGGGK